MQTIIVTDDVESWQFLSKHAPIVQASDYLINEQYAQNQALRVINLCQNYGHQTIGYYVSLLAHARDHKAIPSVHNIQDVLNTSLSKIISQEIDQEIQSNLKNIKNDEFILSVYFGKNISKFHRELAHKLYGLFPLPMIRFTLKHRKDWQIKHLQVLSMRDIPEHHKVFLQECAEAFLLKKRFHAWRKKQRFHDLAILVDPHEKNSPSNPKALERFIIAGEKLGLNVDIIDRSESKIIAEYDALFIRATTAVNHYTYRLARRAAQENMVVIDDPQSIVKCSNKVYLAELMRTHQILTPKTLLLSKHTHQIPSEIEYPCVLKKPDSCFSQGVIKIEDEKSLQKSLNHYFKTSELVVIQPFIPTEYDWRIGIMDNKPIFACRYYMAQNHWQIYNWDTDNEQMEGKTVAYDLADVPENVVKTALKCAKLIGDGLYGVDIKHYDNKNYVIEVNDNPSIDYGLEDQALGDALYETVMQVFLQRIRRKHGYV